jgi:transcriptional regulator of heat shock response
MQDTTDSRKQVIFRAVVREYVKTAEPVASAAIFAKYRLGVSPATIRNDMVELEEEGLLRQPHTSAGRIPTPAGYRVYVAAINDGINAATGEVPQPERQRVDAAIKAMAEDAERAMREFARAVAALTDETVFISVGDRAYYITGVTHLMTKPEFQEPGSAAEVSRTIDELDLRLDDVRNRSLGDIDVLIAEDNPFGASLSSVITRIALPDLGTAMLGIVGPTRMDYDANVALARYIHDLFTRE